MWGNSITLHLCNLEKCMRYEPKLSGLGQSNSFRFTLDTGWYCPFYTSYTELSASPVAGIISGTLMLLPGTTCNSVWIWQYPQIFVLLTGVWWTQLSCIVMTTERKFHQVSLLAKLCYAKKLESHGRLTSISRINWIVRLKPFHYQLMHIMLKNFNTVYLRTAHDTHAFQVTICSHSTDDALHSFYADTVNQMCNF